MDKKAQKKLSNKIRAKKIVDNMNVRMVKLNKYDIRKDLSNEEYTLALKDFMRFVSKNHIKGKKEEYNEETPYMDIVKDFLSTQHLGIKEDTIETLELEYPEYWELLPSNEE